MLRLLVVLASARTLLRPAQPGIVQLRSAGSVPTPQGVANRSASSGNASSPGARQVPPGDAFMQKFGLDICAIMAEFKPTPAFCMEGSDRFTPAALTAKLPGFAAAWQAMVAALPGQPCCMGVNHLFAVYAAVTALQPGAAVESGAAAGHTTFLLRHLLGPAAPIFVFDPVQSELHYPGVTGILGWRDPNPNTVYFTGPAFQDLSQARFDQLLPDAALRAKTLLILDDHQSVIERLGMLRRWGFRDVFYEDNYPFSVSTSQDGSTCPALPGSDPGLATMARTYTNQIYGDSYSANTVCSPVPPGTQMMLYKDRFGKVCKFITLAQHQANVAQFKGMVASYFEFPAVFTPCPNQRQALAAAPPAGLPTQSEEIWAYTHLFPPLIRLKPLEAGMTVAALGQAAVLADAFKLRVLSGEQVWAAAPPFPSPTLS